MAGLVSVIVPVYNVEPYLPRCLDSLLDQTYEHIEIIVVNDGSTDGSGEICRAYAQKHAQIAYHAKENEGISATRNFGLERACGEYVMFVDSDDHIDADMVSRMVDVMEREQADLVQCAYRMDYRFGVLRRKAPKDRVWDHIEALHALLRNREVNNFVWAKLYRRTLIGDLRFSTDWKGFEDVCFSVQIFLRAKRFVTMHDRLYHYVQHRGSFMNREGLLALDMEMMLEMRASFAFQEQMLRSAYPAERFSNLRNYFNTDMMLIYTMIMFVKKADASRYEIPWLDADALPLYARAAYRIWLGVAKMKFGRSLRIAARPQ